MAKDMAFKDHPKYGVTLGTSSRNNMIKECYANSIVEARKLLFERTHAMNWSKVDTEIFGFAYEYGKIGEQWGVKTQLAYITYDKNIGVLWWGNPGDESRVIKQTGTLGIGRNEFWQIMNTIRGFR